MHPRDAAPLPEMTAPGATDLAQVLRHLRAPELAADGDAASNTAGPAGADGAPPHEAHVADRPPESAPLVEGYEISARIGEGGMGTVWRATQLGTRREVALKLLHARIATSQRALARFEREVELTAQLEHPSIARVYDSGVHRGTYYYAMELIEGPPITRYCDEQALDLPARLRLFSAVCDAVQHAHHRGVIHRDLKPSNVLVARPDGAPIPKVIDFGIAKAVDQALRPASDGTAPGAAYAYTALTDAHQVVGTPLYMSPEQAEAADAGGGGGGGSGAVDTRSDVYSLGVLLYELITGSPPYHPGELRGKSLGEIQRVIREVEPQRPSTRLGRRVGSVDRPGKGGEPGPKFGPSRYALWDELDWIVMRCLEKEPSRRYASAGDLAADVRRHLAGEPVSAGPPSGLYRLRKFARRNKALITTLTAVAAALVVGSALAAYGTLRATRARADEARERRVAGAVSRVLQGMLASVDPDAGKGREVLVRQVLDEAAKKLDDGTLAEQPEVEAAVRGTIGRSYVALGHVARAEPQLHKALDIRRRVLGSEHLDVAESLYDLGTALQLKRDEEGALQAYHGSIAMYRRLLPPGHPTLAHCLINYGIVLGWRDEDAAAEATLREALELSRRNGADADTAKCLHCLGGLRERNGDYAGAAENYRQALSLYRKALGDRHRQVAIVLGQLGMMVGYLGDLDTAEKLLREQIEMTAQLLGDRHPHTIGGRYGLAVVLDRQGRAAESDQMRQAAQAMEMEQFTSAIAQDPTDAASLSRRGELYAQLGKLDDALADFDRAIALRPDRPSFFRLRGEARVYKGLFHEALDDFSRATDLDPGGQPQRCVGAYLSAYLGDAAAYRARCQELLRRFGKTDRREVAERTVQACVVLPGAIDDATARLLDQFPTSGIPVGSLPVHLIIKGMAEYRAGRYEDAVASLVSGQSGIQRSLMGEDTHSLKANAELFLAMAHHRLGHAAEARRALRSAVERIDTKVPAPGSGYIRAGIEGWLICQTVRHEAEEMVGIGGGAGPRE